VLALTASCTAPGVRVFAQAEVRNLTQPIPMLATGGHSAPVRALVFAPPDGAQLLSAGFDKIVNVWSPTENPPGLSGTIRPRIWRGYAGAIYSIALASRPGADGQRLLAVAGVGVTTSRGEISLYRFPGAAGAATGDVAGELPGGDPQGHAGPVTSLAFDPRGRFLASASTDTTVRIWDVATRATVAVLRGHTQPVNAVAYLPGGSRLLTAGADGQVILWDAERRVSLATARPDPRRQRANDPAADAINTMAVSPDGRWVVIGRENGDVVRYEAANLGNPARLPDGAGQSSVETLAISHDGRWLATSTVSFRLANSGDRPRVECDVELRRMRDGAVVRRLERTSNLVYACAFSLDDRQLAYAGGDTQAITLANVAVANQPPVVLAGQGSSLWDVGFAADSRTIGLARKRPDLPDPWQTYEDFDLTRGRARAFALAELSRAVTTWNGWTVRPVSPYALNLLNAQNRGFRLTLDPLLDRRWWCFSFLPPGPGHPRPTVAIGCESGVAIYRLDDGTRTRLLAGHSGPVYAMAPSPDGRWLVTGSSDQTARLWRLAGCDTLAPLGARFTPASGTQRAMVAGVDRFGFAEAMGMQAGDEIETFYIGTKAVTDLAALETVPPNVLIQFVGERRGQHVEYTTSKRDAPALTVFPALDREWIVWTPRGYYETSALGDRKYLGWHRNRAEAGQPTDYFSFDHFENELRRGAALNRFLETADRAALVPAPAPAPAPVVERAPEQVVAEEVLPQVAIVAPERPAFAPLAITAGDLPVRIRAATEDPAAVRGLIDRVLVQIDCGRTAEVALAPAVAEVSRDLVLSVTPGMHKLSVTARDDRARERTVSVDLIAAGPRRPAPAPVAPSLPPPQLVVLAIGAGAFGAAGSEIPPIAFADEDTRALAAFLAAPLGKPRFARVDARSLVGAEATSERINQAFHDLDERRSRGELEPGDAVFVMVESHLVNFSPSTAMLGSDARGRPPEPAVSAALIADCLGQLADYGCKVVLLVDPLHERRPDAGLTDRAVIDWARTLYRKNVITFVASIHGPSQRLTARAHGAFAQGVLDAVSVRGAGRLTDRGVAELTLFDFQDALSRTILALTNRQQHARCYIPETIPSKVPLFEPQPPRSGVPRAGTQSAQ
jgi:WD40 repeat protein